jgi:DNA-binding transcriptional ArsR family regulator
VSDQGKADRDQQILSRLAKIEHKVDSLEQTSAFALRAEEDKHFAVVKKIFKSSKRKAQVYLAADGRRGVQEIAEFLGMKRQNVGPELKLLAEEGLLELIDSFDGRDVWGKKPLDRTLRISRFLTEHFALERDGTSSRASGVSKRAHKAGAPRSRRDQKSKRMRR